MIAAQGVQPPIWRLSTFQNDVNINFTKGNVLWTDWCQRGR